MLKTSDKEEILKAASVNIRNEREDVTTDPTDTKGIIRLYDEHPMSINVKQMMINSLKIKNCKKWYKENLENPDGQISLKIELIIKNLPKTYSENCEVLMEKI